MGKYIGKRLLLMIPVVIGVAITIFTIMYFVPGDPAQIILGTSATEADLAAKRTELGLDQPYLVRLGTYLSDIFLHGNFGNKIVDGTVYTTFGAEWNWMHDGKWNYFETTMDGVNYNVYFADYYQPVAANETTEQLICGVYLDKNVDMKDGKYIDTRYPNADLSILEGTVKYPVFAVAVQADGFDTAAAAMDAAFGANYNPWGGDATNWQ